MVCYKATDAFLNRVRQFYSQCPLVVPAQRVEIWPLPMYVAITRRQTSQNNLIPHLMDFCLLFPKDTRSITCVEKPCCQNMQVMICRQYFPNIPKNMLDQQFIQLQPNASNLELLFEAIDELEDALITPRNTAT
ncbi:MAG: hypothetical protein EZS28_016472 [Streblomastix strix]|uniref:Uncharacterized protein n=1 Tax=Streblomastix strix TaxID=222440 RepID=A0A5J4VZ94_9EUKA|nr:MAG: hypothetical protein EZS28_016472 [Streblomastix strix]